MIFNLQLRVYNIIQRDDISRLKEKKKKKKKEQRRRSRRVIVSAIRAEKWSAIRNLTEWIREHAYVRDVILSWIQPR